MQHASGPDAALARLAATHGLDGPQTAALARYVHLLAGWRRGNVAGLTDPVAVVGTLIGDSLALLAVPQLREREGAGWLDLGAGAGVPGVPLAVALPWAELTLLDSAARSAPFSRRPSRRARSRPGPGWCARAASATPPRARQGGRPTRWCSLVLSPGSPSLVELAAPLLAEGGVLLASKTRRALAGEAPAAAAAARRCGLAAEPPVPFRASPLDDAVCAVYRKTGPTPEWLPRRAGHGRQAAARRLTPRPLWATGADHAIC